LDLDRNNDDGKDGNECTENELRLASETAPRGRLHGLTFNRQAKSLAMAVESRTPPPMVHRILSNGSEARALTSAMTPSTAILRLTTIGAIVSRVALLALMQPAQRSIQSAGTSQSHHSPSSTVIGAIILIASARTTSKDTSFVCWS
jgi:hypothetical protein